MANSAVSPTMMERAAVDKYNARVRAVIAAPAAKTTGPAGSSATGGAVYVGVLFGAWRFGDRRSEFFMRGRQNSVPRENKGFGVPEAMSPTRQLQRCFR